MYTDFRGIRECHPFLTYRGVLYCNFRHGIYYFFQMFTPKTIRFVQYINTLYLFNRAVRLYTLYKVVPFVFKLNFALLLSVVQVARPLNFLRIYTAHFHFLRTHSFN